jgi:hypothetical protein
MRRDILRAVAMPADLFTTIRAEIGARMDELRPSVVEYEELLSNVESLGPAPRKNARVAAPRARRGQARRGDRRSPATRAGRGRRAPRGAAADAILAALEHGSHTLRELVVVTAMADANIRANIRRLLGDGTIVKTSRQGKTAYALPRAAIG